MVGAGGLRRLGEGGRGSERPVGSVEAAGGATPLGDGLDNQRLAALHVTCDTHPSYR